MQWFRPTISTLGGPSATDPPTDDFRYLAEAAGEAARRKGLQPSLGLAQHLDATVRAEGARCFPAINTEAAEAMGKLFSASVDMQGIGPVNPGTTGGLRPIQRR